MNGRTIIVGGGLAGLAAAVALARRNVPVTLLESRPRLGGRAGSFVDQTTGELIDNCQHVSMGCCTNFQHFCQTVGTADLLRTQRELFFIGQDGKVNRFSAGFLPAPFHLLPAFRGLSYLSRGELKQISRGLRGLVRVDASASENQSFADWLKAHGQSSESIKLFWEVVLVGALSESMDRIDVLHARKVFVDAFLSHRRGWEVQIPTVPLEELYGTRLIDWLTKRGASVKLKTGVDRLLVENDKATAVKLRNGETLAADRIILAVPHHRVMSLLPESLDSDPQLQGIGQLQTAPISSVHLWFEGPVTELPHAVFVDHVSQWMFNRTLLQRGAEKPPESGCYYQVVISASRDLERLSQEQIISQVVGELAQLQPEGSSRELLHSRVVTEHKAVFSPLPGVDALRPKQQSPISNLQLAGDWTETGWPATMEGAVRSGYLAAENVLRQLGRPEALLQPDLPVSLPSKWLLGL